MPRVALVTGGTRGIGAAICKALNTAGYKVAANYGGNRDKAAWKMVGYPGLPATYREEIKTYFGKKYDKPPRSIADFS